jgi:hypothetical protein
MTVFTINLPKAYRELGLEGKFEFDTDRGNEGAKTNFTLQGMRYTASARMSHAAAKVREDGGTPDRALAESVLAKLVEDCYAAEWPERARAERETVSLDQLCWEEVLESACKANGWLVSGRKAREATADKPAVEAREAVTVRTLLAEHGSPEALYRAANHAYIVALRERDGKPVDEEFLETVRKRSDTGWAAKQKAHRELLRARQKAASAVDAEEGAL